VIPSREFYDYEDKYLLGAAQFHLPPRLAPEKIEEVKCLAVAAFQAVDCSGLARVDFLLEASTGKLFLNEINTFPGFTSISMYPKMWAHDGIPFARLVERLIELALERHQLRQALRYEL
jgi:D-alanine-D-alanine ligase